MKCPEGGIMKWFIAVSMIIALLFSCNKTQKSESKAKASQIPKDFTLTDLQGNKYTLSKLKGKVVVIDFWATWCPPCRVEIPHLIALYNKYKNEGFIILGIGLDKENALRRFAENYKINYPVLLGTSGLARAYNVTGIPTTFIINKKGQIASKHVGFAQGMEKELESEIITFLGK